MGFNLAFTGLRRVGGVHVQLHSLTWPLDSGVWFSFTFRQL